MRSKMRNAFDCKMILNESLKLCENWANKQTQSEKKFFLIEIYLLNGVLCLDFRNVSLWMRKIIYYGRMTSFAKRIRL